jgi:hypothetical protein
LSDPGFTGPDRFTFAAGDGQAVSAPAEVEILTLPGREFVRGINLYGPAVTIEGDAWLGHAAALADGLNTGNAHTFDISSYPFTLDPVADADTGLMFKSAVYYPGAGFQMTQTLSNGSYEVSVWLLENFQGNGRNVELRLEGVTVAAGIGDLPVGRWERYGPYAVTVTDGVLDIDFRRFTKGDPVLFGLAIHRPAGGNLPPVVTPVADQVTDEDVPIGPLVFDVSDPDTATGNLLFEVHSSSAALFPTNQITLNGTGSTRSLTIVPAADQSGSGLISVVVSDGAGGVASNHFLVTVNPVNDPPVVSNATFAIPADTAAHLVVPGGDVDGDPVTFTLVQAPTNGLLTDFDPATGAFTYTPAHAFAGADSIVASASDGILVSDPATVLLTVSSPADADGNGLPDEWETAHGVSDPAGDADGDGLTNLQEYLANTDPNEAWSCLPAPNLSLLADGRCQITWGAVGGTRYRVQFGNGGAGGYAADWTDLPRTVNEEICPAAPGQPAQMSFTDDFTATGPVPASGGRYYRVRVVR